MNIRYSVYGFIYTSWVKTTDDSKTIGYIRPVVTKQVQMYVTATVSGELLTDSDMEEINQDFDEDYSRVGFLPEKTCFLFQKGKKTFMQMPGNV